MFRLETRNGRDERIVTDGQINGHPVQLALDTGAGETIMLFAPSLARLKLTVVTPVSPDTAPVPGRAQFGTTSPAALELLGQTFPDTAFAFVEVPPGIPTHDMVDGLIGWPAIYDNIWGFFLGNTPPFTGWITAVPAEATGLAKFSMVEGATLSLRFTDSDAAPLRLIIDTGNPDGVLLAPAQWQAWLAAHPTARRTIHASFMYGQSLKAQEVAWADELSIRGLVLHGVPVQEADPAYLRHALDGEEIVVLGLAALKRLELILDGKNRTAYAQPSATPPPRYLHNRTGVEFLPRDDTSDALLAHVIANGPAARVGIRDDDQLLSVNGLEVRGWRNDLALFWKRTAMSAPAGTQWDFGLRRGDAIFSIKVIAEDLLGPTP